MKKYIITISREFGCNARVVGLALASKLGVPFYDKDLVDMAAHKAGVHIDVMKESDEVMNNKQNFLFNQFVYGSDTSFYSETAINTQVSVIREVADKGESCILFGRCSDYVLREYPNVINLFFFAPLEKRIAHIAKTYELTEKEAEKMIKRIDKQRHNYYKYVTGRNRGDRQGKHLMIDVIDFGVEGSVELIEKAINIRFSEDK